MWLLTVDSYPPGGQDPPREIGAIPTGEKDPPREIGAIPTGERDPPTARRQFLATCGF